MLVKLAKQYTADEPAEPWEQFYAQRIASHSAVLTNRSPWPHAGAAYESARVRWTEVSREAWSAERSRNL